MTFSKFQKYLSKRMIALFLTPFMLCSCSVLENKSHQNIEEAKILLDSWKGNNNEVLMEANSLLRTAIVLDSDSVPAHLEYARLYIMSGDRKTALETLNKAQTIDPNNANVYVLLGHVHYLNGDNDSALQALNKAEEIGTDNPWFYMNKADVYDALGKVDDAMILREKAIHSPNATVKLKRNATSELGNYFQFNDDMAKAEKYYDLHIEVDPQDAYGYFFRGLYLACEKNDILRAEKDMQHAQSLRMNIDIARGLGVIQWLKWYEQYNNNSAETNDTFKIAKNMMPDNPIKFVQDSCMNSKVSREFGNNAEEALRNGINLNPNDIARFYQIHRQYNKAVALSKDYDIDEKYLSEDTAMQAYLEDRCEIYNKCDTSYDK